MDIRFGVEEFEWEWFSGTAAPAVVEADRVCVVGGFAKKQPLFVHRNSLSVLTGRHG